LDLWDFFILCVQWLLRQQDGQPFRAVVQANPSRIMNLATGPNKVPNAVYLPCFFVTVWIVLYFAVICCWCVHFL